MQRVGGESRLRARRRQRRLRAALLLTSAGVVAAAGLVALLWAPFWRITKVEVSGLTAQGAQAVSAADIEALARADISGSWGFVIPKSNILLYPRGAMVRDALARFPALASVSVNAAGLRALRVSVVERHPAALWCGEALPSIDASSTQPASPAAAGLLGASASSTPEAPCSYLDASGFAYAPAPGYSGDAYRRYFGGLASSTVPGVGQYLPPVTFRALSAVARMDSVDR